MRFARLSGALFLLMAVLALASCGGGGADVSDPEPSDSPPESSAQAGDEDPLPAALAGLPMAASVVGPEAVAGVEQLHGKGLGRGLDDAWIGRYGDDGRITLWISRSFEEADAIDLLERMVLSIDRSDTPFTAVGTTEMADVTVYELDGMGQKHYYFRIGSDLFWLAAPPDLAPETLDELLEVAA